MMNAELYVEEIGDELTYFHAVLKLIVYGYLNLKNSKHKYSRSDILQKAKHRSENQYANTQNPIEDYLRNDLINKFIIPKRTLFQLDSFVFISGAEEYDENIKVGILDIKVTSPFLTDDNIYFIFECKRLNKYSKYQHEYINNGITRFTSRKYYPESDIKIAGMLGFVEVDLSKYKNGLESIDKIVKGINDKIKKHKMKTSKVLEFAKLHDDRYEEVNEFKHSYYSKHIRDNDDVAIKVYHLLLDYYDILVA